MIKQFSLYIFVVFLSIVALSCGSSSVSSVKGSLPPNIKIALAPSGGVLADAIGVELFNRGYTIFDTNQMSNMLVTLNLSEIEMMTPKSLKLIHDRGIDAIISVKAVSGSDGNPQSASIRINSTSTGEILAGLSWQNGWGGQEGSILDRSMRKGLAESAKEIVNYLIKDSH